MRIVIDPQAGPCPGVRRALKMAEENLSKQSELVALGPVIHNQREMNRLVEEGLQTISQESAEYAEDIGHLANRKLLIRTHGITKQLRKKLDAANVQLIDATCSIVRRLQQLVQKHHEQGHQIVIVGKAGHPEVTGLLGYCDNRGIVIESESDLDRIDRSRKVFLLAQTTVDQAKFLHIREKLFSRHPDMIAMNTTCAQINRRHEQMSRFAASVDVVLFVGGKNSSNTAVLHNVCRQANPRSYRIESLADLDSTWLQASDTVGITGGASTPLWQLQQVEDYLEKLAQLGYK